MAKADSFINLCCCCVCQAQKKRKKEKTFLSANIIHWVNKNKLIQVYFLTNSKPYTQVFKKKSKHILDILVLIPCAQISVYYSREDVPHSYSNLHFHSIFLVKVIVCFPPLCIHYISQSIASFSSNDLQAPLSDLPKMKVVMTD